MRKLLLLTLAYVLLPASARAAVAIDKTVSKDQGSSAKTVATAAFSTTSANELLLAFISTDAASSGTNTTVTGVTGGGLTWALVARTNGQLGTAEIWRTFAPAVLTNVTVTATLTQSVVSSLTVMTFTGVDTSGTNGSGAIGAVGSGSKSTGAPTASLVTTRNNSWVFGVGNDWDKAVARTPATGQTIVHSYLAPVGDTYWVQELNAATSASGTAVTLSDTAPTGDRYNLTIAEVRAPATTTTTITPSAGTPQGAIVNTTFGTTLQSTVKDASNNPIVGATVTFAVPASGASGSFAGGTSTAVTNSSGVATAAAFTANTIAGAYTVTASASGAAAPANFLLTNIASAPATVTATAGANQSATINFPFATNLQATVKDSFGNAVSGALVTFGAPMSGASGSFAGGANTATTNASGVASAAQFTANGVTGPYTVTATVTGATAANFSLTNNAVPPASISATGGNSQSAMINSAFTSNLQATVRDASSNPVSGVTVTFSAPGAGASGAFSGGNTAVTNSSGVATAVVFTANSTAGSYAVTASVSGVATPATFTLTNTPGTAASVAATAGTTQSVTINTAFATNLQATVKDVGNNGVPGVTVTFTAPSSGASGAFAGGINTAATNSSGVATAPSFTANSTPGGPYSVTASVSGVTGTAAFSLTNTTARPAIITSTAGTLQSATVNMAFGTLLKATVLDAGNNPVSGATVTFADPVSGPSGTFAGPTAVTTDGNGVATAASFTANSLAGSYTVTATVTGVSTPANFNLTNNSGSPALVSATAGTSQSTAVNTPFGIALQATVRDASSNPVGGVPVTFAAPPSGASGTFSGSATVNTNSSGVATAPALTANGTAGSYTVTATVSGLTPASFNLTNTSISNGIKLLQTNVNGNESGTSNMSLAFASGNTAGDFLIVTGTAARPASTLTVSDTLGNAYLTAFGPITDVAQNVTIYVWYVPVSKGGPNTVTITPSVTAALEIHVSEWSGLATTSPVDQTASATGTGTTVSSGTVTPSVNGELIFGYGWVDNTANAGVGYAPLTLINGDLDEYKIQSTAGSVAATFTQTSGNWLAAVVAFKPAGWSISGNMSGGAGAQVALSGFSVATVTADASGNYTFSGLNNGTYLVTPSGPAFDFDPFRQTVVLNGASQTGVNFSVGVATDWLMVDHDQSRTGYAFQESTLTASNVGNLQFNWSKTLDGNITAQPLFVHNIAISGQTRDILVVGTGGNSIYVLDAGNGAVMWNRNFGAPTPNTWGIPDGFGIEAPPVIDRSANRIYTVSTDGGFRTISLLDGTDVYPALPLIANPVTNKVWGGLNKVNNSVYVVSASNGGDVAPWRGQVYQVDVSSTPALKGDFAVVPSIPAPNGGGGIWGYGGAAADVVSGDVFITTSYDSNVSGNGNEQTALYSNSVVALDKNANLLGYFQAPAPVNIPCNGTPCDLDFASTPLYFQPPGCPALVTGGSKNGNLYLFRLADLLASGQPLQVLALNAPQDSLGSGGVGGVPAYSPALNMVYITDAGPGVTGINAGVVGLNVTAGCTLQVAWSATLGGSDTPNSTPTVANGIVFVGEGLTGLVHAYNAQTGVHLWQSPATYRSGATFAAPIVAGGKVYAASWSSLTDGGGLVGAFSLPASTPILTASPTSLTFTASLGGSNPAPSPISVTNTGGGALNFTASSDSSWLTVSPTSGAAPQTLQASVSIAGLAVGTYTGHITITASGAQGSPSTVTAVLSVTSSSGTGNLSIDTTIFKDNGTASKTIVSPTFSTASANELLLAFIGSDFQPSQSSTNVSVTGITGGGLTWVLVQRTNVQSGTAEIWRAFAASKLASVAVTATLSQTVQSSMTIMSFAGVDTTGANGSGAIGTVVSANSAKGAPTGTVVTTRNNSWVVAAGMDYDNAINRTVGAGQTLVHLYLSPINDTYWAQRETSTTPLAGTSVTINDTAPTTDRFNLAIAEILPALSTPAQTYSITGAITPAASGSGAAVALTGTSTATALADGTGTYNFTALGNGSYSVTPTKAGFSFNPPSQTVAISGGNVNVPTFTASASSLGISPKQVALTFSATQQFSAVNFAGGVNWLVDGVSVGSTATGTITPNGLYAPPSAIGAHTVTVMTTDQSQSANAIVYVTNNQGVFTYHNDNQRTGQNASETVLTTANVNSAKFGKLFTYPTDGTSYASPLYVANVAFSGNILHDVVYVATAHDSVYAFDADTPGANPLWKVSFLSTGVTTVPSTDAGDCCDMAPEIGITGTPVIDQSTGTLYVVAKTKEVAGGNTSYVQRLHALDITTGVEKFSGPVVIQASISGTGDGVSGGKVSFDPLRENQRPALLLSNGVVYIGFAAHGDVHPWHGWLLGYNAANVQQQTLAYNATANGYGGGIWQSGGGPAVDASGNIFFATGNGTFDANTGGVDYGDSVEKLSPAGSVLDYFTPHDQDNLNSGDLDLGSAGPVLLLDQSSGSYPHILISAGKGGTIYVINRDGLGHYNAANDSQIIQELVSALPNGDSDSGNFSAPVFFNGYVYFGAVSDTVKAFQLNNGMLNTVPSSHTAETYQNRGGTFAISANGTANGILWTVQDNGAGVPGILYAYDATNLSTELYNSSQAGPRDSLDVAAKFIVPLVANGKVFVVTKTTLTVFGPLP